MEVAFHLFIRLLVCVHVYAMVLGEPQDQIMSRLPTLGAGEKRAATYCDCRQSLSSRFTFLDRTRVRGESRGPGIMNSAYALSTSPAGTECLWRLRTLL